MKKARLHIFLGAGGVGKTTLAAGYALHLARSGRSVGLLSIDPAKRLQGALGVDKLNEAGVILPGEEKLRAAMLEVGESLRRWTREAGLPPDHEQRLFEHPLFQVLSEKIATAVETLAPVRMAEWVEQYPDTDDLIIDTAPGIHAVDFLVRPERLLAFLDSRMLNWLKYFAGEEEEKQSFFSPKKILRSGTKALLGAMGKVGGQGLLLSLCEMMLLMDLVFLRMVDRLERARQWIRAKDTSIFLVSAVRDDAAAVARELADLLEKRGLAAEAVVLNRTIPESFRDDPALESLQGNASNDPGQKVFASFLNGMLFLQKETRASLIEKGQIVELPILSNLEQEGAIRKDDLARLGALLQAELSAY